MIFPTDIPRKASGIYAITCLRNGKCYVGSATSLNGRFKSHLSALRMSKHHGVRLQRAWNKYGAEAFLYEILEFVPDRAALVTREQLHMDLLGAPGEWGYNTAPTAGSMIGFKMSAKTRAVMSAKKREAGLPESLRIAAAAHMKARIGQKMDPAVVKKIRVAKRGKPVSAAAHEAALRANLGHHRRHSDEARAKMAMKATGRVSPQSTRDAVSKATKGVKWTPERTAKRIATYQANRIASGAKETHAKWTPERRAKFIATYAAKRFEKTEEESP